MELQWRCQEGRSKVRVQLWQVQHPWDTPSQGFWGASRTRGAARLSLGAEVMGALQAGQGLAPTHTPVCARAAQRESSSAQMGLSSPCGFLNPSTKFPWPLPAPPHAKSSSERHFVRRC